MGPYAQDERLVALISPSSSSLRFKQHHCLHLRSICIATKIPQNFGNEEVRAPSAFWASAVRGSLPARRGMGTLGRQCAEHDAMERAAERKSYIMGARRATVGGLSCNRRERTCGKEERVCWFQPTDAAGAAHAITLFDGFTLICVRLIGLLTCRSLS